MLFNSFPFLFGFLPLVLLATHIAARFRRSAGGLVLTILSLGFYAWWRPVHLPLLLFAIVFNYLVGARIQRAVEVDAKRARNVWLAFGIAVDLGLLGYFKYANFLADNANTLFATNWQLGRIALPLAISFFTFQKIAYLIDSARGEARRMTFFQFALFAAFFPQLIAGPIVHYSEVVPQFAKRTFPLVRSPNLLIGLVIFAIGLAKKTIIADTLASYADPLYNGVWDSGATTLMGGWLAATTFMLQLYFDFSGYSDMAIGLARMFGVKLPLNFHSPLRAASVAEYWRRWHMTLQRFIVAYIFWPLALPLSRYAATARLSEWPSFALAVALPTLFTFVVVGIWHGAGWTFILFGAMHGLFICVNEIWAELQKRKARKARRKGIKLPAPGRARRTLAIVATLVAVMFSDVMFRAASVHEALAVWRGMIGLTGLGAPVEIVGFGWPVLVVIAIGFAIIFALPNTQQIMRRYDPASNWREWKDVAAAPIDWTWRPNLAGILFAGVTLFLGVIFIQRGQAIFLYFNF